MGTNGRYLQPRVLQILGAMILIAAVVFWMVTGQQSALLVGAAISLIGMGAYSGLRIDIKTEPPPKELTEAQSAGDTVGKIP